MPRNFLTPRYDTITGSRTITADWNSSQYTNPGYIRAALYVKITAVTDTPSVIFAIQGKDVVSGDWYTVAATAALTAAGTILLTLGPGQNEVDDVDSTITSVNGFLPRFYRVQADGTWGGTDDITFTAGLQLFPS